MLTPSSHWFARAAAIATIAVVGGAAVPAHAATPTGKILASPCLNFHSAAKISAPLVGCIPVNKTISINCTTTGDTVTGPYGAETIWDHTTYGGTSGYVADAWVYTGTSGRVAAQCTTTPPPTKVARAVAWLKSVSGSTKYDGYCELMVENAYGTSGKYPTAYADYVAQKSAGAIHTTTSDIPVGALVFYSGTTSAGHVEIYNGSGQYWTSDGTVHLVNFSWGGTFYGWSTAPSSWPGV